MTVAGASPTDEIQQGHMTVPINKTANDCPYPPSTPLQPAIRVVTPPQPMAAIPSDQDGMIRNVVKEPAGALVPGSADSDCRRVVRSESRILLQVETTLDRSTLSKAVTTWGLYSLCLLGGARTQTQPHPSQSYLMVGHVNLKRVRQVTSHFTMSPLSSSSSFNHDASNGWTVRTLQTLDSQNTLLPGDAIVSINGRPISSMGNSIQDIKLTLRNMNKMAVQALRCSPLHLNITPTVHEKGGAKVARHAYQCLCSILSEKSTHHLSSSCSNNKNDNDNNQNRNNRRRSLMPQLSSTPADSKMKQPPHACSNMVQKSGPSKRKQKGGGVLFNPISFRVLYDTSDRQILTNPLFGIEYSDNEEFDPTEGTRASMFLCRDMDQNFGTWLAQRKAILWRPQWNNIRPIDSPQKDKGSNASSFKWKSPSNKKRSNYSRLNNGVSSLETGRGSHHFLCQDIEECFPSWLAKRKTTWRQTWKIHALRHDDEDGESSLCDDSDDNVVVNVDFWTPQGYSTFQDWLMESKRKWTRQYSWNQKKRRKLVEETQEVVHFPSLHEDLRAQTSQFQKWLRVRKKHWLISRRKRQRFLHEQEYIATHHHPESNEDMDDCPNPEDRGKEVNDNIMSHSSSTNISRGLRIVSGETIQGNTDRPLPKSVAALGRPAKRRTTMMTTSMMDVTGIDALLEEQDERKKELESQPPMDVQFVFDPALGAPDDVIALVFCFLDPSEHWKFLCVSHQTSSAIQTRTYMWQQLCPKHWILPRRPRKPWHNLYMTRIREDEEERRHLADGILTKAASILDTGDLLVKIERLVGSSNHSFPIDYTSGIVLERNSLLNIAVIFKRHKVVKWLIDTHGANIETQDRGSFTPLINAAWAGDKYLVRYLMSKGCDRTKIGTGHYSQPLAHPDFAGHTAEGWARKRGFPEIAELIRLGL